MIALLMVVVACVVATRARNRGASRLRTVFLAVGTFVVLQIGLLAAMAVYGSFLAERS